MLLRAPISMLFTSPRKTTFGQIDTSSPSLTDPITVAAGSTQTLAPNSGATWLNALSVNPITLPPNSPAPAGRVYSQCHMTVKKQRLGEILPAFKSDNNSKHMIFIYIYYVIYY